MFFIKILIGFLVLEILGSIRNKIVIGKWFHKNAYQEAWEAIQNTWRLHPLIVVTGFLVTTFLCLIIGHYILLPFV